MTLAALAITLGVLVGGFGLFAAYIAASEFVQRRGRRSWFKRYTADRARRNGGQHG